MLEIRRSIIISIIVLIIISLSLKVYLDPKPLEENEKVKIPVDSAIVIKLISNINKNELLRYAKIDNVNLKSEEIIKYVFDNLKEGDYQLKLVKPLKISCNIDNIKFTQESDCTIRVISNETIKRYENELFNITLELEFKELEYKGETCQNNGYNYYCLEKEFENHSENYSYIKDSYIIDKKLYIEEYYLNIDETNRPSCLKYYGRSYCENKGEKPYISDETIMKYGVLYKHVYSLNNKGEYYLEKLYILDV